MAAPIKLGVTSLNFYQLKQFGLSNLLGAQFGGFFQLAGANIVTDNQVIRILADRALEGTA
jgi:hypothetical protein